MINKKNTTQFFCLSLGILTVLTGCDSRDSTTSNTNSVSQAAATASSTPPPQVLSGYTYKYINDGSCKAGENEVCISADEYESFCKYAKGMTKSVGNRLGMSDGATYALYQGGFVELAQVYWNPAGPIYKCRAKLIVQGDYQGSSKRSIVDGAAMFFKADSGGDLLVTYADPASP